MKKINAFTLAETLITLSILGIVAALTVPNLVRRQVEASNRTKIKKAVGVYDSLMTKLTVQNNLKSNAAIQEWATNNNTDANCTRTSDLFKVVKFVSTGNNKCKFKTADGVFWDITDIQKPIIALKETDLNNETAQSDTNRAFYLFAEFDGTGILRITEPTYDYTLTSADKTKVNDSVDRLYEFLAGKTTTSLATIGNEVEDNSGGENSGGTITEPESVADIEKARFNGEYSKLMSGEYNKLCGVEKKGCYEITGGSFDSEAWYRMYDSEGNFFAYGSACGALDVCEFDVVFSKSIGDNKVVECYNNIKRSDSSDSCYEIDKSVVCNDVGMSTEECANL